MKRVRWGSVLHAQTCLWREGALWSLTTVAIYYVVMRSGMRLSIPHSKTIQQQSIVVRKCLVSGIKH